MTITSTPASRERHGGNRNVIEEVVICIQLLTTSPNPPLQTTAQRILRGLSEFVESSAPGNAHQLAFNSINAVVTKVMFDQSELVRSVLLGLIPVIRRLWATKLQILKEELLATLMLSVIVLVDTARKDPSESLAHDIEGLASALHSEYVRRSEKEILQIDETILYQYEACRSRPVYGPRLGTARSEHNWTVLWLIAELLKLSEDINTRIKSLSAREGSSKRQRFSSEIQDIFRDSVSATGTRRLCALQLVPFLESEVDIETKEPFFKQLASNISDGDGAVSSWTMVALTSGYGDDAVTLDFWQWTICYVRLVFTAMGLNCANEDTACSWVSPTGVNADMWLAKRSLGWYEKPKMRPQNAPFVIVGSDSQFAGSVTDRIQTARVAAFDTSSAPANPWDLQEIWSLEQFSRQDPDDTVILDLLRFWHPPAIRLSLEELITPLSKTLEHFRQSSKSLSAAEDVMDLDLEDRFMAETPLATDETILTLNRNSLSIFLDPFTYQRCVTIQLSIFLRTQADSDSSSSIVEYLAGLDEADILAAQAILPGIFQLCSKSEPSGLLSILEDLGERCLQSYEMERCEASHCVCIRMMTSFVDSWTNGPDDALKESAMDLYNWFMEVLLARKRAAPNVYIALAKLIQGVIDTCPSYGNDQYLPSPRTTLFTILREGGVQVKFSVAKFIPGLFERFLLKDHDAIFDDVLESLPRDPEWIEGIAVRLFVLSQLASRWHTLLRRSIYHLFETPAQVPLSLWYAERCMVSVAQTLGLQDAKELFRLFSSQILYTWSETQSIMSMPFSIFGYDSLQNMLLDVKDEIVGQMIMRAKEQETIELAKHLQIPHLELLANSFHKAEAYSIARDISTPPGQGSQPKGVEIRLRKLLGADQFMVQIESQFPQIIATFFKSLDYYDQIERAFSKRENFSYALDIQTQIIKKSTSQNALPANQQPSFRARYLLDEIEFLCRRTGFEFELIWTPSLVSFICRSLLESIHPALGSLHACSVIRKIRILTCVAGSIILQDYPLEMTLSSLRPFLGDIHCSEDALGIFWYLLEAGKPYLEVTPGFTAGIAVSTLVTLRRIFSSLPENTTQESQFREVQSNAKRFYQWLVELLGELRSSDWDIETKVSFDRLVSLAEKFSTSEGSAGGQFGKDLVFEILKDRDSVTSLLSNPVADLVLSLLCPEFEQTSDTGNWVSNEDVDPASHVVSLWRTLQNSNGGSQYRLWAARVIGRSFAATGKIDQLLLREQDLSLFQTPESSLSSDIFCHSKARILRVLCDMLHVQKYFEAGLVERTLQLIVSNIANYPDFQGCSEVIPESLMKALIWNPYTCPAVLLSNSEQERCENAATSASGLSVSDWARSVSLFLSNAALEDPVIGSLRKVLNVTPGLAVQLLPYVVHDVLLSERDDKGERGEVRENISAAFRKVLCEIGEETLPHAQLVINCILYLRNQPVPDESTIVQRDKWLDIDFGEASLAAHRCRLHKTSLLFLEIQTSRVVTTSRRSSVIKYEPPPALLHDVFRNIDDPDLFYGIQQSSSLANVMERLEYESSGFKNLLFQSAKYDSEIQMSDNTESYGVLKALNATNLQGIANTMLSASSSASDAPVAFDSMLQAATSLQKWDIPVSPLDSSPSATVFRTFQSLNTSGSLIEVTGSIESSLLTILGSLLKTSGSAIQLRSSMRALGIMTEISDTLHSVSSKDMEEGWADIMARSSWLKTESYHEVGEILSWHEALFSSVRKNDILKSRAKLSLQDSRLLEAKVIRQSLEITRTHGISQASLKSAMSLSKLAAPCAALGMNIDGAAKFDLANVLWDQGEMTASIRMLQQLKGQNDLHRQAIPLSRAELLVTLGHHVAEARLEKPDSILQEYLYPAVKELKGSSDGEEAGRVYHGFATFCDQQLLNPDGLEDFKRVEQLRNRKEKEVLALEDMMRNATGKEREYLKNYRAKAKQWFDLDDREYQRLLRSREAFLQQCLENYLLSLRESDAYNNDSLRFCALWLDKSDSETANSAVSRYLNEVPSRKFAPLMNQLSSRLLDVSDDFQTLLTQLVFRICAEHPFHGMYQIFASSKSKGGKDQSSHSRFRAANQLVDRLKNDSQIGQTWIAVHNVNISYVRFAIDKPDSKYKSGAKVPLKALTTGQRLGQDAITYKLPPPTMKINLRADCNYSDVPTVTKFHPEFTIASGVSAPKIVTAVASNGERYKQLYKGGNDDLRQDAIMEQVFEQVSSLLKDHQPTRQRSLGIRTYKVLPLTPSAGIIEFVPNTIPLHDYLMPAHQKYFPKDMKPNSCRKHIADVQTKSFEQRVRTYRQVTEHFHPVLRYFFMEKFNNPDDWFSKRLAYTRSTAAISILGHVLGLGDRHGHNILLDEKTGEVVHIDLGVAFEQGRVLPVPEVVPFRLTRDLVDGFGITKTEGVFRRCCEFTLEALRQESYSIMTILDVLRYDPLYSWTVSPLRIKKMQMQDNQAGDGPPALPGAGDDLPSKSENENEPSEADLQQACDEKNLAMLYCGWASYA
ncbi:PIK-related kinase FATC [Penicillium cf. griseofulvum]|nr:PIK-related kinase FATC [Penicillium cf. griseofulvum]